MMQREELIKKWLDHNLSSEEQKAFERLEDYKQIVRLNTSLQNFKAPDYSVDSELETVKNKLNKNTQKQWLKPLLKLVAVLVVGFGVYYFTADDNVKIDTLIAQQKDVTLPDASSVKLNAVSELQYSHGNWDNTREVFLNGEAFFKVAKGAKFDVKTKNGIVSVLGTEFNVKQRNSVFEVTCFEGSVAVTYNNENITLKPGQKFAVIDGKIIANEKEKNRIPKWTANESSFSSRPLRLVINELQRQYDITVKLDDVDDSQLFTGSFTHNNLDLALKSITLPLGINYSKTNDVIVLKNE